MRTTMVDTRVVFDATIEGGEDAEALVSASSSHEASEVDGLVDVGGWVGVEHPSPRGTFGERPTAPWPQKAVSAEGIGIDGPTSPEAFRVQFASVDESADLHMGDSKRVGGLVDVELVHTDTAILIR